MNILAAFSGFSVDNHQVAKEFYTNVIGLELEDDKMGLHFKLPGGGNLFIYERPGHQPATFTVFNLVVSDIDAAVDDLVSKGVKFEIYDNVIPEAEQDKKGILRSPDSTKYGPSIAWFKDPAGNVVSVIQDS